MTFDDSDNSNNFLTLLTFFVTKLNQMIINPHILKMYMQYQKQQKVFFTKTAGSELAPN